MESLSHARPLPLLAAVLAHVVSLLLRVGRWRGLLAAAGIQLGWGALVWPCFVGWSLNAVVPGRVGEIGRPLLALPPASLASGLGTVAAERVLDVAILGVILAGGLLRLVAEGGPSPGGAWWAGAAVAAVGSVVAVAVLRSARIDPWLGRLAPWRARLAQGTDGIAAPGSLGLAMSWTVAVWVAEWLMALFVFEAVGVRIDGAMVALFMAATTLALALPAGLGNAGINGWIAILALGRPGQDPSDLLAASLLLDALTLAVLLPGGLFGWGRTVLRRG